MLLGTVLLAGSACSQSAPVTDSPEARLEQARALTTLEVESGALDNMLDEGAALARKATADMLMLELMREPSDEDLADGRDRWLGALIGGAIGGAAGNAAERSKGKKAGWERIIRLDNGEEVGIEVPMGRKVYASGDRVRLTTGRNGQTRVTRV